MTSQKPRRFFLLSHPRTASNLLVHILALDNQPNVAALELGGYFFVPVTGLTTQLGLWGKHVDGWNDHEKAQIRQSYQSCFSQLEDYVQKAMSDDRIVFVKEHSILLTHPVFQAKPMFGSVQEAPWMVDIPERHYGPTKTRSPPNETIFPDEYLRAWNPIFLIRHPALTFPSRYRAFLDLEAKTATAEARNAHLSINMTFHATRALYDWYGRELSGSSSNNNVTWPIVLDADDIICDPGVTVRLAEIMGMDVDKLQFSWSPLSQQERERYFPSAQRLLSTLHSSGTLDKEKAATGIDLDTEIMKWKEEFGERDGAYIERCVRDAMADYEFLRAKRLRSNKE
jgi:hypothetical protein